MSKSVGRLGVIGGGVLGGQIAWHSAYKGKTVAIYDIDDAAIERCRGAHDRYASIYVDEVAASPQDIEACRSRLRYTTELSEAVGDADLVIEAVPEVPEIKQDLYARLSGLMPQHAILATNSSTFLPAQFAEASGRPAQFCALHFANLIWKMNMAEVMAHPGTSLATLESVTRFAIDIGMVPIPVGRENHGYLLNAWLVPLLNASQTLVTNAIGSPDSVDRTYLKFNPGGGLGPFGFMDVIGIRTCVNILAYWGDVGGDAQMTANAEYLKTHYLDKGRLGIENGKGIYSYPNPAFEAPDFLDVPNVSATASIARQAFLG
ncbi:3-hydroxyacyl-CoA dehydrogenase [Halomonas sp. V046]|uniref:3-hydroxyacyl-CoA dehydrogenase n=1 Tax=Halomonas sp. V046 TaxID=3459611 RepID=UPI0040446714